MLQNHTLSVSHLPCLALTTDPVQTDRLCLPLLRIHRTPVTAMRTHPAERWLILLCNQRSSTIRSLVYTDKTRDGLHICKTGPPSWLPIIPDGMGSPETAQQHESPCGRGLFITGEALVPRLDAGLTYEAAATSELQSAIGLALVARLQTAIEAQSLAHAPTSFGV